MIELYRKYLLPGLVFQSVVIGGGYATGRELIEFFFANGPVGGVLGLLVAGLVFGVVLAVGFEFARRMRAYDYRHFCRALLGRGWVLFEVAFCIQLLLVLSVIGSAAGELTAGSFGLPSLYGTLALMALVALLTFSGSNAIKRVLAGWSVLLYLVYAVLVVLAFRAFGDDIARAFSTSGGGEGWLASVESGVRYSGYNLAVLPAVLFAINGQTRRQEAVGAGLIAGLVAIVPALLFFIAMMGRYPAIGDQPIPASYLIGALDIGWLELVFQVVVFGTFVETGTALLHAVNERLEGGYSDRGAHLPRWVRPLVATAFLALAIFAAERFGIISLIADGYNLLTLVFIALLIVPLMTIGLWKLRQPPPAIAGANLSNAASE